MIVQIELHFRKCTKLVQSDVKKKLDLKLKIERLMSAKSMYVLKQAPRAWYGRIDSFLTSLGFTKSKVDSNLYFKVMNDEPLMLLLYEMIFS
jgi:hypothetical protein